MMISVFSATITEKCGVWCKKEYNIWFGAKESPTCGVISSETTELDGPRQASITLYLKQI
jgi:hypothetical protein